MVTFSLPGDNDGPDARGTPRPRPPLPFAKRSFGASPYGTKRLGTPQTSSARKLLTTRDEIPSSSLNKSSIATARNIFRASSISDSPTVIPFSPSLNLPQSTPKKVFAPGATPEPSRVYRESTAQATPRGMAARTTSKDLFPMRIADPDPELSGEVLTRKIPKDWNSKGSIYADQFLAHLCPPDFDDEQRRQFFCILDLRRLKYAANEIFSKKDWKLNVINFAKEFEKSRSIILLRYGLYEFQNVKPSKDVLKRWRREHGIAEPEDEENESTPSKATASKKRKADEESFKETARVGASVNQNKRRATVRDEEEEETAPTPAPNKNKRKVSISDESETQPSKMQKSAPSAAKSLFEKIANKSTTTPTESPAKHITKSIEESSTPKPNPFAAKTNGSLARSVFQNLKPGNAQPNANIFGYLSDASSAKNSSVEADAESSTDSEPEESQEAGQSDEQDAAASNAETASQIGSSLFGQKVLPAASSSVAAGVSSTPGTRESTPGRSLFERVTKNSDGHPVRAEEPASTPTAENTTAPADQTWNPTTTPLKFAPSVSTTQPSSLFGSSTTSAPTSSMFAPKTTTPSNIFGAAKKDKPAEKEVSPAIGETDKGGESDKENDSQPTKKSLFEAKAPAAQPSFGSGLFQPKPAEAPKEADPVKTAAPVFGGFTPKPTTEKPSSSATAASNVFASVKPVKPSEFAVVPPTAAMSSSTLFGAKPAGSEKPAAETPKPASLFGAPTITSTSSDGAPKASLFGAKPPSTASTTSSIFGGPAASAPTNLFGSAGSGDASTAPKTDALAKAAVTSTPTFSFGTPSGSEKPNGTAAKSLFGAPKSPTSGPGANSLFSGSPMKQDNPSPAKKAFNGGTNGASSSTPIFSFGTGQSNNSTAPTFGGASSTPTNGVSTTTPNFGAAPPSNAGSGGFGFSFGGASSGSSFSNPFAGNSGDKSGPASGSFNFGSNAPSTSGSSPFQFGNASGGTSTPAFGAGSANNNDPKPVFGGAVSSGAPAFNFQAASPQPPQGGNIFGSGQPAPAFGNLHPPAGGASTTGTNTPFSLGGGSSLATTPAGGTPEPSARAEGATGGENEEGEKHDQINLTEGLEADEENLHEVRAKVLKFKPAGDGDDKPKSKSPWTTQGIGPLRLLKHKETNALRLLLRAEPRGHVAMNRAVLPDMSYKADEKYVKLTTSNETGDGLETWMIQVKTKELAKELAERLEEHKKLNKK
ncbi:Fc.00g101300.m01.CDS01 [Cosmosporella sp. VM-42]